MLRVNVSGQLTTNVDRIYMLNPWPGMGGLAYQVILRAGSFTHIMTDTKGRGAIRYIQTPEGRKIRVDVYLIPMNEISKHVSDKIRLGYYGSSPVPALIVNSCGYNRQGKLYYEYNVPATNYHTYTFQKGAELALDSVPDGRHDASQAAPRHRQPMPKVGSAAPEVAAKDWLNAANAQSLKALRGKTVLVEFWATWCGPCLQSIPHLNELQAKYADKGFVILSFTEQSRQGIEPFLKRTPMQYAIGVESPDTFDAYGIVSIPQAFLVDASGTINWEGSSGDKSLDEAIQAALTR
jgi:thiol-disulfide isomerase/thioredoxin